MVEMVGSNLTICRYIIFLKFHFFFINYFATNLLMTLPVTKYKMVRYTHMYTLINIWAIARDFDIYTTFTNFKPHSHCADVATVHPDGGQPVYRDAPGYIS